MSDFVRFEANGCQRTIENDGSLSGCSLGRMGFSRLPLALFVGLAVQNYSPAILAQNETDGLRVEEVVVTARKREESLQDVPVSMTVVKGDFLEKFNIQNLESLSAQIPTFQYSEAVSGNDQVFVRGVGSGVNFGFENTVGQVFDGFFMGRARFGRASFMDVDQIEVLKGPQGAIVGKNTSAGLVNTRWAKPTDEFSGNVMATWAFEGDEGYSVQGAVSGPLSERLRGRIAYRWDDKEGYFDNVTLDDTVMQFESPSLRGTLEYDFSESVMATLVYQFSDQERYGRVFDTADCPEDTARAFAQYGEECELNYRNTGSIVQDGEEIPFSTDTTSHFAGLTIDWSTGLGTVSSLTGFAKFETDDRTGPTIGGLEGVTSNFQETYEQFSQELRLVSSKNENFDYIIGAYYQLVTSQDLDWNLDFNAQGPAPFAFVPPPARLRSNRNAEQESESIAFFGEVTKYIGERVDLTGSVRFTREEKEIHKTQSPSILYSEVPTDPAPFGPPPVVNVHDVNDSLTENQWTPSIALRWRPVDDAMLYASVSTGFKGGGFDFFSAEPQETVLENLQFTEEEVIAYEVGGKFSFPDARLTLNVAAFLSQFDDLQVTALEFDEATDTSTFRTVNAAAAITRGLELDFTWQPLANLRFNGALAYLDAYYDDFDNAPCYAGQTAAQGCVAGSAGGPPRQDLGGEELQYAPDLKGSLTGQYSVAVMNQMELSVSATVTYSSEFALQLDLDPRHYQDDYTKVDVGVALQGPERRWRIALVGRNLTDELTTNFGNDDTAGSSFFAVEPPRTYALQGSFRF